MADFIVENCRLQSMGDHPVFAQTDSEIARELATLLAERDQAAERRGVEKLLTPLTQEEADRAYNEAEPVAMPPAEVERIVASVLRRDEEIRAAERRGFERGRDAAAAYCRGWAYSDEANYQTRAERDACIDCATGISALRFDDPGPAKEDHEDQ